MRRVALFAVLCVIVVVLLSGCSTVPKMPIKLDPNYSARNIDTIVLMPVIDRRVDKKSKLDLENNVRIPAKRILAKKGYNVVMPNSFSDDAAITADNVGEMNVEELSGIGPKDARALLFIYVDDVLDDYVVLAYSYKIEATGSLIEKQERAELWRDKGIGSSGQGGLASGILSGLIQSTAVSMCLEDMFCTLPKCPVVKSATFKSKIKTAVPEMGKPIPVIPATP